MQKREKNVKKVGVPGLSAPSGYPWFRLSPSLLYAGFDMLNRRKVTPVAPLLSLTHQ